MPRRKNPTISPWLSARTDNRERRFIQAGNTLLLSKKFQSVGTGAQYLYLCMAMESAGHKKFCFPESAAKKYGIASTTLWRHIKQLETAQLILVYSRKNLRKPNIYEFSYEWKTSDCPPARSSHLAIYSKSGPK